VHVGVAGRVTKILTLQDQFGMLKQIGTCRRACTLPDRPGRDQLVEGGP
jgi:hypothetical protein